MMRLTREISKEQYERARDNGGFISERDKKHIFSESELFGYGIYSPMAYRKDDKYYVSFMRGLTCD